MLPALTFAIRAVTIVTASLYKNIDAFHIISLVESISIFIYLECHASD
jgi:hypothetical protein